MNNENNELKTPTYTFAEVPEGELNPASPIRKKIAKTMEITESFTLYEAMQYIAKLKKAIADKDAEKEGLEAMLKAYEAEFKIIEEALGVQKLEEEYQKALAEDATVEVDSEVKEVESE